MPFVSDKKTTRFEDACVAVFLRELRRALRRREQFTMIIDPFTLGGGAHISVFPNESGNTYEIVDDEIKRGHKPAKGTSRPAHMVATTKPRKRAKR